MALKIWGPYQMSPVSTSLWLYMELTSETVNVSDNSSTVYFRLYLRKETGGNYNLSSGNNYSITVDGQTWSGDHGAITSGEIEILLYSGSKKVYHDSDGSKTISLSGSFANKLGTGASTGSQSYTLTKIARTSAINSITNVTLNASSETSNGTVKFTPASSSYYYRFSYTIGTYTQTFDLGSGGSTSEVNRTFTIPNSAVSQISTGSISVTGTLETFTGQYTGSIGSTTKAFTVYVGSGHDPSLTSEMLYLDEFNEQALTGKTKIQTISSAVVSSGATISKYETTIANSGGTVQYGTGATYTSGPIASSGTYTVTVKVTDSRGKTASETFTTKNFIAYTKPSIKPTATATRVRSTDDGYVVDESEGTVARITYEVVGYTTLVGNQKHVLIFDPITRNWTEIFDNPAYLGGYTIDSDFIFQIKVYDEITSIDDASPAITVSIGSAKFPLDFMPSGNGAAFGMVANKENTLETPWDIISNGVSFDRVARHGVKAVTVTFGDTLGSGGELAINTTQKAVGYIQFRETGLHLLFWSPRTYDNGLINTKLDPNTSLPYNPGAYPFSDNAYSLYVAGGEACPTFIYLVNVSDVNIKYYIHVRSSTNMTLTTGTLPWYKCLCFNAGIFEL